MTQLTILEPKLARSRRRLTYLIEMQKRPNLSAKAKKQLPALIEMQEIAVRMREREYLKKFKIGEAGNTTQH